jgi:hypothetical protein
MPADPVRMWLSALGALCAGSVPEKEANARVDAYAPMLSRQFDRWAFCQRSLDAVARQCKFWPAYGELCEALSAWCRANRPPSTAPRLAGPDALSPAEYRAQQEREDREWWEMHIADVAARRSPDERWLRGTEMNLQVNQPDSFPRPWIVPLLNRLIAEAAEEGADTTQQVRPPVRYPQKGEKTPPIYRPGKVPGHRADMAA